MPLISVIIPTYNTALLIGRTLRSVLEQTGNPDFEILVIDDCSTDDTLSVVSSLADARIRVFRQERNQGPSAARNRGLREAKGIYCAFLDGDDFWEPEFLNETVSFLESHTECVAVSVGQCHKIIGKQPSFVPKQQEFSEPVQLPDFFDFWAKYNHVCTGSVLMRTTVAREAGGQREDLRVCEDLEFWALLATYGPWGFIHKTLFTSDGGKVTRKQGWLEKNMRRWQSAPTMEDWVKRLATRQVPTNTVFQTCMGRIARNLAYCQIMSQREKLARRTTREYGKDFPQTKLNKLLRLASASPCLWHCLCALLRFREYRR
jgi:glycosyltransferase involved in cell wall biosynthesis